MNDGYTFTQAMEIVFLFCIAVALYFLPFIIATKRKLAQTHTIGLLNLFLGITTVGWIILVIFASLAKRPTHQGLPQGQLGTQVAPQ